MRNTLMILALSAAGLTAMPAPGHAAEDKGGFFVNGSIGQSTLSKGLYDDNDTAYNANIGYRWALAPNFAFGIEGGYTDLGKWSPETRVSASVPGTVLLRKAELSGWTAGVNAHWNLGDNWYLSGRTGLFRADIKGDYLAANLPVGVDDTSNKWYAGAGVGYDFSDKFSVGLNYDYYKADKDGLKIDPDMISVSAEARF